MILSRLGGLNLLPNFREDFFSYLITHLITIIDELAFQLYKTQDHYKNYTNRNWKLHPNFHIGDYIWLVQSNLQTKRPSRKLDYQRLGPFKIIVQINPIGYCLELPSNMHIHPIFHVSLLELYKESQIDHDMEYELKEILDSYL